MQDINDEKQDVTQTVETSSQEKELAALSDLFKNYDKPAIETGNTGGEKPVNNTPASEYPWLSVPATGNSTEPSAPKPFITHDPNGSLPKTEYYVRGPKKGQPKPASKSKPIVPQPTTIQASSFLTGAILLSMVDLIIPMALVGLNNWRSKVKLKPDSIKMTDAQKRELSPIADAVLKEMNVNASPTTLLMIALLGVYVPTFLMVKSDAETQAKLNNEKAKKVDFKTGNQNGINRLSNLSY